MILLDTSVLIDALTGGRRLAPALRQAIESGEQIAIPTLVLYEWQRGPRRDEELAVQEALWPGENAIAFGADEAAIAADLYRALRHPRGREIDLAIAACAICRGAELWTMNVKDFRDVPGLMLYRPGPRDS
ncbi:MAG: type II toxin-antitoxin system VapC family toxin [Gemmatimonadaceae bacterium]|nr:type II toxin-antitoxin system VapC family toxin [Gemmatimonadaceae bacterium]